MNKIWLRIGLAVLVVAGLALAMNWQRLAYGPCMKLYENPQTGEMQGRPYGSGEYVPVDRNDPRMAYWMRCSAE